ncbi:hypothetical protein GE061_002561 [Apolygus lucorum]|uniref:Borealin C-terminal domain-containing protein n=1 Tax=Apolygus lucorum TaxID=248454 RepID=A0A6A4IXR7_APOLU|nr:hypothetical protein GE061_002561 [Apolygus lucorum]
MSEIDRRFAEFRRIADEQYQISVQNINERFGVLIDAFEADEVLRTAVWDEKDDLIEIAQSLINSRKNKNEVPSKPQGSGESSSRKVTWATPSEPMSTKAGRRSKSADPGSRHTGIGMTTGLYSTLSNPDFKTPMQISSDRFRFNIATVTLHPSKATDGTSTTALLRKPKVGETAISMGGSPLLVPSDHVAVPSITVPLTDGRVFNVLGNSSQAVKEQLRSGLDAETVEKLKDLKDFINQLVP